MLLTALVMCIGVFPIRFLFLEKILQHFTCFFQLFRLFRRKQGVGKSVFRLGFYLVCDHSGAERHDSIL